MRAEVVASCCTQAKPWLKGRKQKQLKGSDFTKPPPLAAPNGVAGPPAAAQQEPKRRRKPRQQAKGRSRGTAEASAQQQPKRQKKDAAAAAAVQAAASALAADLSSNEEGASSPEEEVSDVDETAAADLSHERMTFAEAAPALNIANGAPQPGMCCGIAVFGALWLQHLRFSCTALHF